MAYSFSQNAAMRRRRGHRCEGAQEYLKTLCRRQASGDVAFR